MRVSFIAALTLVAAGPAVAEHGGNHHGQVVTYTYTYPYPRPHPSPTFPISQGHEFAASSYAIRVTDLTGRHYRHGYGYGGYGYGYSGYVDGYGYGPDNPGYYTVIVSQCARPSGPPSAASAIAQAAHADGMRHC